LSAEPRQAIRAAALAALARREYGSAELLRKLIGAGFPADVAKQELQALQGENLLSDQRMAENLLASRISKGQGPLRIRQELRERGADDETIAKFMDDSQDWLELARQTRRKRFGAVLPKTPQERAKQARFLAYRGFSGSQIKAALAAGEAE
jgi:regulatory protein